MSESNPEYTRRIRRQLWNEGRIRRSGEMRPGRDGVEQDVWVLGRDEQHLQRVAAARTTFTSFNLTKEQQEQFLLDLIVIMEGNQHAERRAAMGV